MKFILFTLLCFSNLSAYIISSPANFNDFNNGIDYDFILSSDEASVESIRSFVKEFSPNEYELHLVPKVGLFFLDLNRKSDWIKDILRNGAPWENYLEDLLPLYVRPGSVALDIGAHIGTHTLTLSRAVGHNGHVIAFEPQLKTFRELFMNSQVNGAPNIYCYWAAVSDSNGFINLPNFIPQCEIVQLFDFSFGDSGIQAPMIALDTLELDNVSFMKVDVDGYENAFLDGAQNTIRKNKPTIIIEIQGGYDIDSLTTPKEIIDSANLSKEKLVNLGYTVQRISVHDYLATPNE